MFIGAHVEAVLSRYERLETPKSPKDSLANIGSPVSPRKACKRHHRVEMEDICNYPTDMMISVHPDGDSWKVAVRQEGSRNYADRREMVEQIAARLKTEYDLKV